MLALAAMQIEPNIRLPQAINWALHKRWVGVCGALASDPLATPVLIGLGVTELSVSPVQIGEIKDRVRQVHEAECQRLSRDLLKFSVGATLFLGSASLLGCTASAPATGSLFFVADADTPPSVTRSLFEPVVTPVKPVDEIAQDDKQDDKQDDDTTEERSA